MDTRWFKITIVGDEALVKGLITGFLRGRGIDPEKGIVFCEDFKFLEENFLQTLKEWIHLSKEMTHILADSGLLDSVKDALRLGGPSLGCRLLTLQEIKNASFPFRYEIFSKEHGEKAKALFNTIPASIRIQYEEKDEIIDKNARGVEVYSPSHEYTLKAKGTASGSIADILALHREMDGNELIQADDMALALDPPEISETP